MRNCKICIFIILICMLCGGTQKPESDGNVASKDDNKLSVEKQNTEQNAIELPKKEEKIDIHTIIAKAESGDAEAMYVLSGLYMQGDGVEQSDDAAYEWTLKAALAGNIDAQFEVAASTINGEAGVDGIDMARVQAWLSAAAEKYHKDAPRGDIKALQRLAWMYETGRGVAKDEQRAEQLQIEATRQMYELGMEVDKEELYNLGVAYYQGDVIAKNDIKAAEIFKITAALGLAQAQYSLALFYTSGTVVEQNDKIGFGWLMSAAKQGHDKAQFEVGQRYYYGYVVEKDLKAAFEWFEKSANNGNVKSQLLLGMMYGKGEVSGEPDYEKAAFWLEMAKDDNEFPIGKAFLGKMYISGNGVTQDREKGIKLLKEAAELGEETAIQALRSLGLAEGLTGGK